ncbi:hypothetical protein DOTSEDRAFT_93128, partial [Dothistroma septosporum NZE10]
YVMLSYYWGDQSEQKQILLDGLPFMVTADLHAALVALQGPYGCTSGTKNLWTWIDSICIDKEDIEERNSQVRQIWRILHDADGVVAWLG